MVELVVIGEDNICCIDTGKIQRASPESESMACNKSKCVNVGDPNASSRKKYPRKSVKVRNWERAVGSQMVHSGDEAR